MSSEPNSAVGGVAIDLNGAKQIALKDLRQPKMKHDFVLLEDKTIEKEFGWVFFYTTRKFVETGDRKFIVPGNGPVVVLRDGSTQFLSSSLPPPKAIEAFEKKWRESKQH